MPKRTIPTVESRQDNRGMSRVGRQDVENYIEQAYRRTAERIAAGHLEDACPEAE
ncbi:hypothetical protein [Arthrobacter sp. SLBN-122]|uniref:hypothetical protein n=1 Tax=Arthrobacter sp. SLBN-122 TaxID=2768455 RepID=UPI00190F9E8E|nr:hypothetical protein [Arthrobacter sp. SLBN-122]